MADLSPFGADRTDRGQIILVAAFILSIAFIVLALVVNSAIFTENLATRDDVAGSHETIEYRHEVEQSVGEIIRTVNEDSSLDDDHVEESIGEISRQGGLHQSSQGRVVNVSFEGQRGGKRIAQDNATRTFESNESGVDARPANWIVAEDVSDTRNFKMNITNPGDGISFRMSANETLVPRWTMVVTDSGNNITVAVQTTSGDSAICIRRNVGNSATIDVTGATVEGKPCHALSRLQNDRGTPMWFANGLGGSYDIVFEDADTVEGTYSLVVDGGASTNPINYGDDTDSFPYVEDVGIVYSVDVRYAYYTQAVGYETTFTVAPGAVPP